MKRGEVDDKVDQHTKGKKRRTDDTVGLNDLRNILLLSIIFKNFQKGKLLVCSGSIANWHRRLSMALILRDTGSVLGSYMHVQFFWSFFCGNERLTLWTFGMFLPTSNYITLDCSRFMNQGSLTSSFLPVPSIACQFNGNFGEHSEPALYCRRKFLSSVDL